MSDFNIFFSLRICAWTAEKGAIKYIPHLKYVTTLPCETLIFIVYNFTTNCINDEKSFTFSSLNVYNRDVKFRSLSHVYRPTD